MNHKQLVALALAACLAIASCAPAPQTRNTARETGRSQNLTIGDEKPGSNNGSNNSSCCSSDPKGSSNSSSNKSVNLDDFRENGKAGPSVDQLLAQQQRSGQQAQAQQQQAQQRAVQQQTQQATSPRRNRVVVRTNRRRSPSKRTRSRRVSFRF